jgi:hypothetical protein
MGTPTYIALATTTLTSNTSTVTFGSIPSGFRDLVVVINTKTNTAGPDSMGIRFNGDTGSNYSNVRVVGNSSGTSSYSDTTSVAYIGVAASSSNPLSVILHIMDYSATDKHKTILSRGSQGDGWVTLHSGRWANTAAITSLTITPPAGSSWTMSTGGTLSLYGIRA